MAVYITPAVLKSRTRDPRLGNASTAEQTLLIAEAQIVIDNHAGYWERYAEFQADVFPRVHDYNADGTTFIPEAIIQATIFQAEFLYQNAPDATHGAMLEDNTGNTTSLSPRARDIMKKGYICRTGRVNIKS